MNIKNVLPHLHLEVEKWKYYMPMDVYISSFGRFKSKEGEILSPTAKNNYLVFRGELVHRLVMTLFAPVPGCAGLTVDHLDHNTRNNKVSNLEWVTDEENKARAKRDMEENNATMLERSQAELREYQASITSAAVCVRLNSVTVPFETAVSIILHAKELQVCKANVQKKLDDFKTSTAMDIYIGNYRLEKIN